MTKAVDRQTLEKYFEVLGLRSLPTSSVAVVARTIKGGTWSAIARVFCVLGSLPAATAEKTEQEEHDLNMLFVGPLLIMLILAMVAGCRLGRCFTVMTWKKKTKRGRDIGTMTDPVIADIMPPPIAVAERRRGQMWFWTTPRGEKVHLDEGCRTIAGHRGLTKWSPCLVRAERFLA